MVVWPPTHCFNEPAQRTRTSNGTTNIPPKTPTRQKPLQPPSRIRPEPAGLYGCACLPHNALLEVEERNGLGLGMYCEQSSEILVSGAAASAAAAAHGDGGGWVYGGVFQGL